MKDRVLRDTGRAMEILYNLDIALSNHYTGTGGTNDKAVEKVREALYNAMNALDSKRPWFRAIRKIE